MGILDLLFSNKGPDINAGIEEYKETEGAVLLDVRNPQEYIGGRIPGSILVPLPNISSARNIVKDKDAPIFVYCASGARAGRAVAFLTEMGYTNVKNIGGISGYKGPIER